MASAKARGWPSCPALQESSSQQRSFASELASLRPSSDEPDIREWALYHLALGVEHIFIRDMESTPPLTDTLADLVAAGSVTVARRRPTLSGLAYVAEEYTLCLKGARDYEWIGSWQELLSECSVACAKPLNRALHCARPSSCAVFIDTDEYIVLYDNTASLPALLKEYRAYPSLRIQWRMFGSSGWVERPPNGMLRSYTACEPLPHPNFKSIVQPKQVTAVKNAHDFNYTQASREPGERGGGACPLIGWLPDRKRRRQPVRHGTVFL